MHLLMATDGKVPLVRVMPQSSHVGQMPRALLSSFGTEVFSFVKNLFSHKFLDFFHANITFCNSSTKVFFSRNSLFRNAQEWFQPLPNSRTASGRDGQAHIAGSNNKTPAAAVGGPNPVAAKVGAVQRLRHHHWRYHRVGYFHQSEGCPLPHGQSPAVHRAVGILRPLLHAGRPLLCRTWHTHSKKWGRLCVHIGGALTVFW